MDTLQHFIKWFYTLSLSRRIILCLGIGSIILGCFLTCWYVLTPTYSVLFSHLETDDANQMLRQLEKEHIDYRIQNNGQDILIDQKLIHTTRLKLMSSAIELHGSTGFELFDKNDFGMTDFSQKINYQRALQGELERTISSLEEVRHARVHLVLPEHKLFRQNSQQPKAAVTVYLKKPITAKQVESIQRFIASSIDELTTQRVVIVDQYGNTLSQHQKHFNTLPAKKTIERDLTHKVLHLLHTLYPKDPIMVNIDATLNYDELQRERITPQSQGLITHEKEIKQPTMGKIKNKHPYQDITRETSYQLGTEKELFKRARGTIERLSVSVILPHNTDADTLKKVEDIVKNSVGFSPTRGDTISVAALIHAQPKASKKTKTTQTSVTPEKHSEPMLGLVLVVLLLGGTPTLIYLKRMRHKKRHALLIELNQWLSLHE